MDILIACEGEDSLYTAAESAVSTFTFVHWLIRKLALPKPLVQPSEAERTQF